MLPSENRKRRRRRGEDSISDLVTDDSDMKRAFPGTGLGRE